MRKSIYLPLELRGNCQLLRKSTPLFFSLDKDVSSTAQLLEAFVECKNTGVELLAQQLQDTRLCDVALAAAAARLPRPGRLSLPRVGGARRSQGGEPPGQ